MADDTELALDRHCIQIDRHEGIGMTFCRIPGGKMRMGSRGVRVEEEPIHQVEISEFWMGQAPVTQEQFAVWTRHHLQTHENYLEGKPHHPAENMTWHEAKGFCRWLNQEFADQMLTPGFQADLPTEAEWEYACRMGAWEDSGYGTEYYSGDGEAALEEVAWYDKDYETGTRSVGFRPSSPEAVHRFGLQEMHGNVSEWCLDGFDEKSYCHRDPDHMNPRVVARSNDSHRVLRGGSYDDSADWCRSAARYRCGLWVVAGLRFGNYGFRVVLVRRPVSEKE